MSEAWRALTRVALLGTERQAPAAVAEGALGELLRRIQNEIGRPEDALLDAAAAVALHRLAGELPARREGEPPRAPDEQAPRVGAAAAEHLLLLLVPGQPRALLVEWLELAAAAGKLAPPEALPDLLELGARRRGMRPRVLAVLGQRGRWLASFRPEWQYAATAATEGVSDWDEGSHELRLVYLRELRARDAAAGRALLEAALPVERARERAELLRCLGTGLSMEDEPLLERLLDDRAREVRASAAELLMQLDRSRLVARMEARLAPLLSYRDGALRVELPAAVDESARRDGVAQTPRGTGQRAAWLEQMIAAVPPSHFCRRFGLEPPQLLAAARAGEWDELLRRAWQRGTLRHRDACFAEALAAVQPETAPPAELWALLDRRRRNRFFCEELERASGHALGERLVLIAEVEREPFDAELSQAVARATWRLLTADPTSRRYDDALERCAQRLDVRIGVKLAERIERDDAAGSSPIGREVAATLRFRREMRAAIEMEAS